MTCTQIDMYVEFRDMLLNEKKLTESTENTLKVELINAASQDETKENEKKDTQIIDNDNEEKLPSDSNRSDNANDNDNNNNHDDNDAYSTKFKNKNIGHVDMGDSQDDLTDPITWLEKLYSAVVESISTADFVTDCFVLKSFIDNNHQWWSAWMILSMIAPYLVSYSVLGSLFNQKFAIYLDRIKSKPANKRKCNLILFGLLGVVLLTPLSLLYFVLIDCFFMLYVSISSIILILSCTTVDIKHCVDDFVFQKILSMNRMEILGYRRLRTLSQVCCVFYLCLILLCLFYFALTLIYDCNFS